MCRPKGMKMVGTALLLLFFIAKSEAHAEDLTLVTFVDLFQNVNNETEKVPVSLLSTSSIDFTGDAFMQNTEMGFASSSLHVADDFLYLENSGNKSYTLTMDFATPVSKIVIGGAFTPDYLNDDQATFATSSVQTLVPGTISINLLNEFGANVGHIENYALSNSVIDEFSPFSSLEITFTDGTGLVEFFFNSECFHNPDCVRDLKEVSLTAHLSYLLYAPIPEPETYAMMLLGLIMLTYRKSTKVLQSFSVGTIHTIDCNNGLRWCS